MTNIVDDTEKPSLGGSELNGGLGNAHAVRWAQREVKNSFSIQYSKWHWTTNSETTLCNRRIMLISDGPSMLPETSELKTKVSCQRCRDLLEPNETNSPAAVGGQVQ